MNVKKYRDDVGPEESDHETCVACDCPIAPQNRALSTSDGCLCGCCCMVEEVFDVE
jgi:hypothetical protein